MTIQRHQLKINLPADAKKFIAAEASRNGSSQNSEIVRCIRERMDRVHEASARSTFQAENEVALSDQPSQTSHNSEIPQ